MLDSGSGPEDPLQCSFMFFLLPAHVMQFLNGLTVISSSESGSLEIEKLHLDVFIP